METDHYSLTLQQSLNEAAQLTSLHSFSSHQIIKQMCMLSDLSYLEHYLYSIFFHCLESIPTYYNRNSLTSYYFSIAYCHFSTIVLCTENWNLDCCCLPGPSNEFMTNKPKVTAVIVSVAYFHSNKKDLVNLL